MAAIADEVGTCNSIPVGKLDLNLKTDKLFDAFNIFRSQLKSGFGKKIVWTNEKFLFNIMSK